MTTTLIPGTRLAFMQAFEETRRPTMFLSNMFVSRPGNRFKTKAVALDVRRSGERVAVAVTPGSPVDVAGPELQRANAFSTRSVVPPNYNPGGFVTSDDLLDRDFGENPFNDPDYQTAVVTKMLEIARECDDMIIRANEKQASQVLQTGNVDCIDRNGDNVYTIDFGTKADHFPTAGTAWTTTTAPIRADLLSLAEVIKDSSGIESDTLILGRDALENLLKNDEIQGHLNFRRAELIDIRPPSTDGRGGTFHGTISVGGYRFELWSYNATYDLENTGAKTKFVDVNNVIMTSKAVRLDRLTSAPQRPFGMDPTLQKFQPGRLQSSEFDVTPFLYTTENRKSLYMEMATRILNQPTQLDGFGCLDTIP